MVMDNIVACLANFLACPDIENTVFCWVMHEQAIIDEILSRLDFDGVRVVAVSLTCDEQTLRERLAWDVDAGLRTPDVVERSVARLPLYTSLETVKVDTTSLAPGEGRGDRLAVPCRRAAPEDEGVVLVTLVRPKRYSSEVKRLEDVGEDELVRKREADDVERRERRGGLEREQRDMASPHERRHVRPGKVGTLTGHAVLFVDALVEDGDAEVRLTHLVGVRINHAHVKGPVLPLVRAPLMVEVARGLLDVRQKRLQEPEEVLPLRAHPTPPPSRRLPR